MMSDRGCVPLAPRMRGRGAVPRYEVNRGGEGDGLVFVGMGEG